jgi:hypothetical protein
VPGIRRLMTRPRTYYQGDVTMLLHTGPARRRALQICAVGGATLGAMFAFGADSALAA